MLGISDLTTFVVTVFFLLVAPGPSMLYVLRQSGGFGVKAGLQASLGVMTGDLVLMLMAALGVASLLAAFPTAFLVIKYLGAAYLVYLGVQAILSKPGKAEVSKIDSPKHFRQGLTITLLNPKAVIFFMAFFPLFIDPSYDNKVLSFLSLGALFQVMSIVHLLSLIAVARLAKKAFQRESRIKTWFNKATGGVFIGFGAKVAIF